ncbi:response regulator [Caldibacillus thermoamylovorans]
MPVKVLIVDDEQHVREGIKLLGMWEQYGIEEIYEAENGEEAIELIEQYRPEIIFSDMKMPRIDGTQLLEWIQAHHPSSKTVVVTGYDDYHYMRKAIHFGSIDYLLKPVDPDSLNETLANAVNKWKEEEADRKRTKSAYQLLNEMKPVYRDRKLTQLLNGESMEENLSKELGLCHSQHYIVAIARISEQTVAAFQGDRDLAYFAALNIINEILSEQQCGIGFRYLSNKGEIVIIFWDQLAQVETLLVQMYKMLKATMNISCPMTIGAVVDDLSQLMKSYQHAKQLLLHSNVLDRQENKVYAGEPPADYTLKSLMTYFPAIELAMQTGEIGTFVELVDRIVSDLAENGILPFSQLFQLENEYQVISQRWLKHYHIRAKGLDEIEKRIDSFLDEDGTFQLEKYKERKKREIALFLKKIKRRTQREKGNIIQEIEKYLQANFDRDVKLQELSERFYISREYISRKFKQEFHMGISDYLVKIRMEKAKFLLKNSQLKIYEIAEMVGYQDDKYFRKVFKKAVGVTPNEYRAQYVEAI